MAALRRRRSSLCPPRVPLEEGGKESLPQETKDRRLTKVKMVRMKIHHLFCGAMVTHQIKMMSGRV